MPERRRDAELLGRKSSKQYEDMCKVFHRVEEGFRNQGRRSDSIQDYWSIYNCEIDGNNYYNGNSDLYVPIVHVAVEARKTRILNRLFPQSGRYVDATGADGEVPAEIVALLEDYVRATDLRTQHIAALLRNGDIEGHYNMLVGWERSSRHIVSRETVQPTLNLRGMLRPIDALDVTPEPIEKIREEEVFDQRPSIEVLHDEDVLVLPQNSQSIDAALRRGGSVTVKRRWTKEELEEMIDEGEVRRGPGEELLEIRSRVERGDRTLEKELIDAAGIKDAGSKIEGYLTWCLRDIPGEGRRLTESIWGGYDLVLTCRRIRYWNDKCPLLSFPQQKVSGAFKGVSPIKPGVASLQYYANQIAQQAADSATYSMLPIVMTDPAKNPRTATMILNLGAVWEIDPNSTRFAEFPKLWQDGVQIIQTTTAQIFQSLGVNPAMLPQQTGRPGAKRNQAEVALEQTVDILTTDESSVVVEDNGLTKMIGLWVDYDHQFRDDDVTVRMYGELGHLAKMQKVPPLQSTNRYHFTWFGVEQARNAAQVQQQIAALNVYKGFEQALAKAGYMLDPAPLLVHSAGNVFGWREGRLVIKDMRSQLAMDPKVENEMLSVGQHAVVHPLDNHPEHIQAHAQLLQSLEPGTPEHMNTQLHINFHQRFMAEQAAQMAQQQLMQQMQAGAGGTPSGPGGQGAGGQPAPGGSAPPPNPMRGPAGMIHPDQMPRAGAAVMPRKM